MMYGFKKQFVAPILAGTKIGTIRAPRSGRCRHARHGDALQLKAGPRFRPQVCTGLFDIVLCMDAHPYAQTWFPDGRHHRCIVSPTELNLFAIGDGFSDWDDLCRYWLDDHGVREFAGSWIIWTGAEVSLR